MPFEPKGEIAQWRAAYRLFHDGDVDDTVTYEQLAELLELDPVRDRHRIQAAGRRAAKHLLETDSRAVEVVPDVGYRIVPAVRQIPMAGQQIERSGRALDRGKALTTNIRFDELSEAERTIAQAMAHGFSQVAEWARQIGRRMENYEGRLSDVEAELERIREQRGDQT
jgi:hypothetical protein